MMIASKENIRRCILALRRQLPEALQTKAAQRFAEQFSQTPLFRQSQRIALYLPFNGELDPSLLRTIAESQCKQWFLPVLARPMVFYSYTDRSLLNKNRYGILEPDPKTSEICLPENLDLVLVPLVAFDEQKNRLGMGGGYYDQSFAFLKKSKKEKRGFIRKPYLLGLAYHFQQQEKIPVQSWDVPVDAVWVVDVGL